MSKHDRDIRDIILRFLKREATDSELLALQQWLQEDASNREYFDRINEDFQKTIYNRIDPAIVDKAWAQLWSRIKHEEKTFTVHRSNHRKLYTNVLRFAASLLILLIGSFALWTLTQPSLLNTSDVVNYSSDGNNAYIMLSDSTQVWLNGKSKLSYSKDFGVKNREVTLIGEAFFDVRKKKGQNFIVKTEQLSIRVKGTRFNVSAYLGENVNTTLEEGKVELVLNKSNKTYTMAPGDQITVKHEADEIILKKVNPSNFTAWKEEALAFDNTPLSDIIVKLENRFKVKIIVDESIAKREHFSMTIQEESLEEILNWIQLSSHLNYKKEDSTIIIYE